MQKSQKISFYFLAILIAVVFISAIYPSVALATRVTKTFGSPDVAEYNSSVGQLVGYCALSSTATQYCKKQGYDGYSTYQSRFIGPTLYNDRLYVWNGSSFNVVDGYACPNVLSPVTCYKDTCTDHYSKKCVGNDVYWYDSCSAKQQLYQSCTANQTCTNGSCVNQPIGCYNNADCGATGNTGSPFCQGANVYQHYTTYN
jgi:hypothetical protein